MDYLGYDKKPKAVKICRLTGLHLLSTLIYNGFPYYDRASDQISEAVFLDRLLNNLSGPREVYKSASEVREIISGIYIELVFADDWSSACLGHKAQHSSIGARRSGQRPHYRHVQQRGSYSSTH